MSDNEEWARELCDKVLAAAARGIRDFVLPGDIKAEALALVEQSLDAAEQRGAERAESALEQARHAHTIELGNARAVTTAALKEASQAEAALAMVEWLPEESLTEDFASYCPWCGNVQSEGHASDCPRQAALKGQQP